MARAARTSCSNSSSPAGDPWRGTSGPKSSGAMRGRPRFVGDMPHGWVASDYVRVGAGSLRLRARGGSTRWCVAAGMPPALASRRAGIEVEGLRTQYGALSYSMQRDGAGESACVVRRGLRVPPGGVVASCGLATRRPAHATVNGKPARWDGNELRIREASCHDRHRRALSTRPRNQVDMSKSIDSFPPASSGAPRRPRIRSKARRWPTAPARASGSASRTRPSSCTDGDTGDVACDHYRRYAEDVALMRSLGMQRLSLQHRVGAHPARRARGAVNAAGSTSTTGLVDALLDNGIAPMVTLFHWDLPAALDDRGGWLNPDIADWFADYATIVFRRLDDRVKLWATLNEPWVVTDGGYLHGALAPGHRSRFEAPIATHNLLRVARRGGAGVSRVGRHQVGLVVNLEPKYPASDSAPRSSPRRRARDAYMNRQYLDPVFLGRYPERARRDLRRSLAARGRPRTWR